MVNHLLSNVFIETLDQAIDGVVVIDSNNRILLYNQAAEKLWGYAKAEVIGKNVKILVPNEIKSNHDYLVNKNRETGVNKIVGTSREVPIMCKDGSKKWGAMSISKVHSDDKILYTAFIKDVTEAVLNIKRLELLSLVTDKTDNAIVITDGSWNASYVNSGFMSLFGYEESEIIGLSPISVVAPQLTAEHTALLRQQHQNGEAVKLDEILQTKMGDRLWCSVMSNPIFNDVQELIHVVIIISEITKTKLHEILHHRILGAIAYDLPLECIMESVCHEISLLSDDIAPAIMKLDDNNNLQLLAAPKLPSFLRKILNKLQVAEGISASGTAVYRDNAILCRDIETDPLWVNLKENMIPLGYTGSLKWHS